MNISKIFLKRTCPYLFGIAVLLLPVKAFSWGFFAHKRINKLAVFTLPPEMARFYKHHIEYITENAVNPDRRRYAVEGEAPCHYIDLDVYGPDALKILPHRWKDAVEQYTEDTLMAYGIVPWHIEKMKYRLVEAFKRKDTKAILRISTDLGHYIADANVPLHTTENYNGQKTGQTGIHGFWESRLPELFSDEYDFFLGPASYLKNTQESAWEAVAQANRALDSVLLFEKELTAGVSEDKKYAFEQRGNTVVRVYSKAFSKAYHDMLDGQVECRMRAAAKMVGDFWFTCWVDAGQPDLNALLDLQLSDEDLRTEEAEKEQWNEKKFEVRPHEEASNQASEPDDSEAHACCCRASEYLFARKNRNERLSEK